MSKGGSCAHVRILARYFPMIITFNGVSSMSARHDAQHAAAHALFAATNAFSVDAAVALFTPDAVIDDPSTGHQFIGQAGIRDYIERYFVGYHTVTRILSINRLSKDCARVRVDFKGDFGHEIGVLQIAIDAKGLVVHIDADLE
jgi:ketosteroid isomerase-like protein